MKFAQLVLSVLLTGVLFNCKDKLPTDKSLLGKKQEEIVDLNGSSYTIKLLIVSDSLETYQHNLIKLFPAYKKDTIRIKELLWEKDKEHTAFWLIKKDTNWIVVDNLRWESGKPNLK